MKKDNPLNNRVNFLYYNENLTEIEIADILNISRQRISAILNSNEDHKIRKSNRITKKVVERKVQFPNNTSPKISIPKDMLKKIGIDEENNIVEIKINAREIILKKSSKGKMENENESDND